MRNAGVCMNIGFIGLGIMGAPMASHLLNAGHKITTCLNSSPLPDSLGNADIQIVPDPASVAKACETIIVMVPDTPQVEQVIRGDGGLIDSVSQNSLIIDMSSISPVATRELAIAVKEKGGDYLDAPVSGGQVGAEAASLTIMIGGSKQAYERALPLFELMGKNITLIGEENGSGQSCKIANQIIVALNIEAVSEALVFASKAGCDPAIVREALMGGFAASKILEVHGERMIKRTFDPGFRIRLHQKDLNIALESAESLGVSLPNTKQCQALFQACADNGRGDDDHSGLVKSLEEMANHSLA